MAQAERDDQRRRFKVCGCYFDEPCDEERHQRNAEKAAVAIGWMLHDQEVARAGNEGS